MTLRGRVTVLATVAVAVAVLLGAVGVYVVAARTMQQEVDRALLRAAEAERPPPEVLRRLAEAANGDVGAAPAAIRGFGGIRGGRFGGPGVFVQLADRSGRTFGPAGEDRLPVTEEVVAIAATGGRPSFSTVALDGSQLRMLTAPLGRGIAMQIARPVDELNSTLGVLRRRLALAGLVGIAAAAVLGALVGRRAVAPVRRLSDSVEHVTATQDLTHRIPVAGEDELGRLAASFNAMLASLEEARRAQHQLVADASHELRTPLTSLRTNIEVLRSGREARLAPTERQRLLADVDAQLEEFGTLVGGLVELARDPASARPHVDVRLDEVVQAAVASVVRTAPAAVIRVEAAPTTVAGDPDRLATAVRNLVGNAVKYAGDAGPIDVVVRDGRVTVRDRGPGVEPGELGRIFDRFHRTAEARALPGSGLGLAIVERIASAHGGSAHACLPEGGGLQVELAVPVR